MADVIAVTHWHDILAREVVKNPRGKAGVAIILGVTRGYVSRVMSSGRSAYAAVPTKFIARVLNLESEIDCPAGGRVARAVCGRANGPAPMHNPMSMILWGECQSCPLKPLPEST